ncbi:MAG: hypothetical protein AAB370_08100 [Verrucomicrobiota bacterium]
MNGLDQYCRTFFGYGAWQCKIWFVGMEEGGADSSSLHSIRERLNLWHQNGCPTLEDAAQFYPKLDYARPWFAQPPENQATWRQLIRVLEFSKNIQPTEEQIGDIQKSKWGRPDSEAAILELFSLPSPTATEWRYGQFANDLFYLKSRELYMHYLYQQRADYLRGRILEHKPCAVFFYGWGKGQIYKRLWEGIVRQSFFHTELQNLERCNVGATQCFHMRHPVDRKDGADEYFSRVGRLLSQLNC